MTAGRRGIKATSRARAGVWLLLSALLLAAPACSLSDIVEFSSEVLLPSIRPVPDAPPVPDAKLSWPFEGGTVTLSVPLEADVLAGAAGADKSAITLVDSSSDDWLPGYYRAFIEEEEQDQLYEDLLAELRSLRDTLSLDSDRYAELIMSLAQSLEYETDTLRPEPRFPIETVAAGAGDCDDKTLLAAALLAREGYAVALLSFEAEEHMALGIRTNGSTYGRTDWGLVEMTTPSLVGWIPEDVGAGGPLTSEPLVIPVGDGALSYGAGGDTDALAAVFQAAAARSDELVREIEESRAALSAMTAEVTSLGAELDRLAAAGRYADYNALVPRFNDEANRLNAMIDAHNELVTRQNEAAGTARRILDGQRDRYGLAAWLAGRG